MFDRLGKSTSVARRAMQVDRDGTDPVALKQQVKEIAETRELTAIDTSTKPYFMENQFKEAATEESNKKITDTSISVALTHQDLVHTSDLRSVETAYPPNQLLEDDLFLEK